MFRDLRILALAMLNPNDYVIKASNFVQQAQKAEELNDLPTALGYYQQALSVFKMILQNKQCVYLSDTLSRYAADCLTRAQQIEETLISGAPLTASTPTNKSSSSSPSILNAQQGAVSSSGSAQTEEKISMMQQLGLTRVDPTQIEISWNDIIGMNGVKKLLDDVFTLPREMPQLFTGSRKVPRSVLLYGPPGTGKTLLGKALAKMAGVPFYSVSSAEIISKYVGESEKFTKCLFEIVKADKPCILFLDEVEALCGKREESNQNTKTLQQFLTQLDGITNSGSMEGVFVLACTNLPWALDEAMRRRLEYRIYMSLPAEEEREAMLRYYVNKNVHSVTSQHFRELAIRTEHFSPDDIMKLCNKAAMLLVNTIRGATHFEMLDNGDLLPCDAKNPNGLPMIYAEIEDKRSIVVPDVTYAHLLEALTQSKSSVDIGKLKEYEKWTESYGSVYF